MPQRENKRRVLKTQLLLQLSSGLRGVGLPCLGLSFHIYKINQLDQVSSTSAPLTFRACYGLHDCVPPNSSVEAQIPKVLDLEVGAFGGY